MMINTNPHRSVAARRTAQGTAATALLAGLATAFLAMAAPAPALAQSAKATCNTLDQNGKPLSQPNIGFICGQVEAMRQDCEKIVQNGNRSPFLIGHCIGFTARDVTATGSADQTRSQSKTSGGSH